MPFSKVATLGESHLHIFNLQTPTLSMLQIIGGYGQEIGMSLSCVCEESKNVSDVKM